MKQRGNVTAARRHVLGLLLFVILSLVLEGMLLFAVVQTNRIGLERLQLAQAQVRRVESIAYLIERLHESPDDEDVRASMNLSIADLHSTYATLYARHEFLAPSLSGPLVDAWGNSLERYVHATTAYEAAPRDERRLLEARMAFLEARAKLQPLLEARSNMMIRRTDWFVAATIALALVILACCGVAWWIIYLPVERRERVTVRALRESRSRFRALFEHNPDAVVMLDSLGRIESANVSALQFFRSRPEQLERRGLVEMMVGDEKAAQESALLRALRGNGDEFEARFSGMDGDSRDALVTLCPIVLDGTPCGSYAVIKDVSDMKAAEMVLVRSERRFRSMFEQHSDGIVAITREGRYSRVNTAFERISGYRGEELLGTTPAKIIAPEDVEMVYECFAKVLEGESAEYEATIVHKDGTRRRVLAKSTPILADGFVDGIYSLITDVTERRELEASASEQARRIRSLYELASTRSTSRKEIERTIHFGAQSLQMEFVQVMRDCGNSTFAVYATVDGGLFNPGDSVEFEKTIGAQALLGNKAIALDDAHSGEWGSHPVHASFSIYAYIAVPIHVNGMPWGVLSFASKGPRRAPFRDIDVDFVELMAAKIGVSLERELQQEELSAMAFYDSLTGLPNRTLFLEHAAKALSRSRREGTLLAFHYLDLDGFKAVNDRYGHSTGDELLREVARRLGLIIRDSDIVARLAGDEFVYVQNGAISSADALALARRVTESLSEPYKLSGCEVRIGASIGVSMTPADGADVETLLKRADSALYHVKSHGKNGAKLYVPA
ncbi:MAG: diguanylate cyclase [Candidatus Eremiobacteraeota bacterium]|nr:diguanylate cyclase [Candidatus Eremiobacteraeota bacterium]